MGKLEGVEVGWISILEQTNDGGILLLMNDNRIYIDGEKKLIINGKSHIVSDKLRNTINRVSNIKKPFDREKIINEILNND